ncbi:nucleotidyltransferase domain-containing protein [Membranicola marinus]|uniref:Nucleotidyltransferase domain-containing protein n=1 Tax=Membranihabitans marinus TaxID=1227546 RepID=A0A953HTK7_9BACT|nr:nucleotidyltransferase domain-containing protein [Membranihabitans marinus]MBY5958090.1 nucleotidyltransferase domain-containing protein [Membranihabitans marinus]
MKVDKENIINTLKKEKTKISDLGVEKIGLFGSYVRGEEGDNSDIDLFIVFNPAMEHYDNLFKLYDLFEEIFSPRKIDIVTHNGLSPYIGPKILQEVEFVK